MAMNQRVMAKPFGSGTVFKSFKEDDMVIVYKPILDSKGNIVIDSSGGALLERAGGVKAGSRGTITGPSLKCPRRALLEFADISAAMGVDLVDVYPVQLDAYSGTAFIIGDCLLQTP